MALSRALRRMVKSWSRSPTSCIYTGPGSLVYPGPPRARPAVYTKARNVTCCVPVASCQLTDTLLPAVTGIVQGPVAGDGTSTG